MERRGLNIRKGFLRAVLPDDPGPAAAGGVAVRVGHRPDGIPLEQEPARQSFHDAVCPRSIRARLPVGCPDGEPRAGRQPCPLANTRPAAWTAFPTSERGTCSP